MVRQARATRSAAAVLALSALLTAGADESRAGPLRSPHTAEACLDCHRQSKLKENGITGVPGIIVPDFPDPHRVLRDQCIACHPGGVPPFWLMILPGGTPQQQAQPAAAAPPPRPAPSGKPTFDNPHDEMECKDCHAVKVSFGTLSGREGELVGKKGDMSDFCLRCHEEIPDSHYPRGNVPTGSTTCISCHQVHHPVTVSPALREDFYRFIRETRDLNPHGGNAYCLVCHPNKPLPGEPAELLYGPDGLDRICLRCHTDDAHHVIGKPAGTGTWKMNFLKYPLQKGVLACLTCHLPHGGGSKAEGISPYSLRGEPYKRLTDFCQKCHEQKEWAKLNAHDQVTTDGQVINRTCLFCHDGIPDTSKSGGLGPESFNDSLTAVCTQCHEPIPHPDADHLVPPGAGMAAGLKTYSQRREVVLPLDFDGLITCVTCHNPHEKGLLTGPPSVGAGEETRLRLTTFNEICSPCHGRK